MRLRFLPSTTLLGRLAVSAALCALIAPGAHAANVSADMLLGPSMNTGIIADDTVSLPAQSVVSKPVTAAAAKPDVAVSPHAAVESSATAQPALDGQPVKPRVLSRPVVESAPASVATANRRKMQPVMDEGGDEGGIAPVVSAVPAVSGVAPAVTPRPAPAAKMEEIPVAALDPSRQAAPVSAAAPYSAPTVMAAIPVSAQTVDSIITGPSMTTTHMASADMGAVPVSASAYDAGAGTVSDVGGAKVAAGNNLPAGAARPAKVNPIAAMEAAVSGAASPSGQTQDGKSPVDYAANEVEFDQASDIVVLTGNVELKQDGRTLKADKVTYDLKNDKAVADGNVEVTDITGDVHHADNVVLTDKMRRGLIDRMKSDLADGSRVWAMNGERKTELLYKFKDASYTACAPCVENPSERPAWLLNAKEVDIDKESARVVYHNAWLDFYGVPVFYTPYFSHPDGTVKRKSGFLTPSFGWNSELGGVYDQPYYWNISPDMDATLGVIMTTLEGPVATGEFRRRWENASLLLNGSATQSGYTDRVAGVNVERDDEFRGHLFGKGRWDINNLWRAGMDLQMASDDQYLRQYDFTDEDVLENVVYAERFEGRNYATVKAMAFQDIRTVTSVDQPNILPYAEMSLMGEPNAMLGGRWQWDSTALGLARDGSGQDVARATTDLSWKRQDIMPLGFVVTSSAGVRGDVYQTTNRIESLTDPDEPDSKTEGRLFPSAQLTAGYPLKADYEKMQMRVEPMATIVVSPDIDNDTSIPNEDSRDVQLDPSNLFDANRFPGYDRIEDQSHVAYGIKTGFYGYEGNRFSTFLGQSYRLQEDSNPFSIGSGLENRESDYVGQVDASINGIHNLNYRFQLDSSTLSAERHELYGSTGYGPVTFNAAYMYTQGVPGTAYSRDREQISGGSRVALTPQWAVRATGLYDLSKTQRGLRSAGGGFDYVHECYNFSLTANRNLVDASSGKQETVVMFRIGLKNLGEFRTDALTLSGDDSE